MTTFRVHANVVDYHTYSVIRQEHASQSPPPGTAARALLSYFSTKLECVPLFKCSGTKLVLLVIKAQRLYHDQFHS